MAQVDWYIEGVEVTNCNCDYACPCQFESPRPTHGDCRGFAAVRIDKGHFGEVTLDGLCAALLYAWPGPIYEGDGECQAVIDERADNKQRAALAAIMYGEETSEGATHWWVYTTMSSTVHPPLFKRFEFGADIESRKARVVIPGVLESTARPIKARRPALSITSVSVSRMESNSTSRRSPVVQRRRWPQSLSTSRIPTFISMQCASRARAWSADDGIHGPDRH
jgi:hypothetical protein